MTYDDQPVSAFFCPDRIFLDRVLAKDNDNETSVEKVGDLSETGFFDWLAKHYESLQKIVDPSRNQIHSIILDILNAITPAPENILDLGCGTGMLTGQILDLIPDAYVYAIDNSMEMLKTARTNLDEFSGQITFAKSDFRDPWEEIINDPIDAVVHYSALHHLPHTALREVYTRLVNVMKPGAWFIHADRLNENLPDPVLRIGDSIRNLQLESTIDDIPSGRDLMNEHNSLLSEDRKHGRVCIEPAMPEQQVAWMIDAGFEFATRVYQDWGVSIFIARKPE